MGNLSVFYPLLVHSINQSFFMPSRPMNITSQENQRTWPLEVLLVDQLRNSHLFCWSLYCWYGRVGNRMRERQSLFLLFGGVSIFYLLGNVTYSPRMFLHPCWLTAQLIRAPLRPHGLVLFSLQCCSQFLPFRVSWVF